MVKPGLNFFNARRKSSGNVLDDISTSPTHASTPSTDHNGGGFRVLDRAEIERAKQEKQEQALKKAQEKSASKFGRFSGFGSSGNKARARSIDEDSPSSSASKRDSKSSSGTQSFTSRPYQPGHYGGSSSTLPSSAESDPNDNIFAGQPPRPNVPQHNSSPSLSMGGLRKNLPPVPYPSGPNRYYGHAHDEAVTPGANGRERALTTSSYASTAIPPKLETDLDFGGSDFDDMFSGLDKKQSPELTSSESNGRSLLAGRRTFQSEPIKIDHKSDIEAPPKSWDSRGSNDQLITSSVASPTDDTPPPPPPPHKYAPIASHSPEPLTPELKSKGFEDMDAVMIQKSVQSNRRSHGETSPERNPPYASSSSTNSFQTPISSSSHSHMTTPRALLQPRVSQGFDADDGEDNMFAPDPVRATPAPKPKPAATRPSPSLPNGSAGKVLTAAEYKKQAEMQKSQPQEDSSDDDDEYEDEEDEIRKREEEQRMARQRQQMQMARDHMRRSTTAPLDGNRPTSSLGPLSNGFPSEISLQADEWSDEDVPLGVLQQHGFPSRDKPPTAPPNATPSHFRTSTPTMPDRPASAGAMGNRASSYRPPFARNLPDDIFIGGGLVQPTNRESMGFSRGSASVYNEPAGGAGYNPEPQFTSLVDQIQMRDMAKQKYMGGASSKKPPPQNPFTGQLSGQVYAMNQNSHPTRMSTMGMQGMNGQNPMMNPMMGGMPMMGMPYQMYPQNEMMMQQMYQQMMQMQAQQNAMFGAQQQMPQMQQDPRMSMLPGQQDPRMSMMGQQQGAGFQPPHFQNNSMLSVNGGNLMSNSMPNRPMSVMSFGQGNQGAGQPNRPFSVQQMQHPNGGFLGAQPQNGYTPSIAPSERSNIGLSARYRSVVTGNGMGHHDTQSITSSMTLQASSGATDSQRKSPGLSGGMVKGILKNKVPKVTVREEVEEEDDWGKLAARKSKMASSRDTTNGGAADDMLHLGSMIQ